MHCLLEELPWFLCCPQIQRLFQVHYTQLDRQEFVDGFKLESVIAEGSEDSVLSRKSPLTVRRLDRAGDGKCCQLDEAGVLISMVGCQAHPQVSNVLTWVVLSPKADRSKSSGTSIKVKKDKILC